ncbi:MAG: DUF202 domain-containing protein [Variovorax sp.]
MTDTTSAPPARKTADELAQIRTDLAVERTAMAADRSLMAWVRTGLSMISFGFTIYKVLEAFREQGGTVALHRVNAPRDMGLFLTGLGTISIVLGTLEYWFRMRRLGWTPGALLKEPSFVIALIMSAAGLFMFVAIVWRVL